MLDFVQVYKDYTIVKFKIGDKDYFRLDEGGIKGHSLNGYVIKSDLSQLKSWIDSLSSPSIKVSPEITLDRGMYLGVFE